MLYPTRFVVDETWPEIVFCFTLIARNFETYYAARCHCCNKQQTPRAQQYTHESYDIVCSQKAQCEAAPDNPESGHHYHSRGRSCAGTLGEAAASEKNIAPKLAL